MAAYFSSWRIEPVGFVSAVVRVMAGGSGLPVETTEVVELTSSVTGGLLGSEPGMNSCTVAVTLTRLPSAAAAGGALEVKTKMPSDVLVFPSHSACGASTK